MIDRGDFEDDQRNKVEIDKSRVRLYIDHRQRIENGFYIGKIMHFIRKTIIKMSKKAFTLDPSLIIMKDHTSASTKEYNWNIVCQELKKFTIRTTKEQKAQLIGGKHSLMNDILQQLYDYDQNLLAHNPAGAQSAYRTQDNNSEMNFGTEFPLEKGYGKFVKDSDSQVPQSDNRHFANTRNSKAILAGAPTKKVMLEPIMKQQSPRQSPRQSPFSQDNIDMFNIHNLVENQSMSSPNLNNTANLDDIQLDPAYRGSRVGLAECKSTLDFILEGLSQSLGMTQSQAATLLANSQKFLIHMCVKGMKGNDFKRLIAWYKLTIQFCPRLVDLLDYEKNDIKALAMTLNVLKCGLFSTNAEVVSITGRTLSRIQSQINSEAQHLQMMVWEWLTISQVTTPGNAASTKKGKFNKAQKDLEVMVGEAGIVAMIRAHRMHEVEITDIFSAFLVSFGRDNYVELFTFQLKNHSQNELEYLRILQDIIPNLTSTAKGKGAFVDTGCLSMILDMCVQICDYQMGGSLGNDLRQVAIELMVQIWRSKPEIVQTSRNDGLKADNIIRILKNGCRDFTSPGVNQTSIHLSFYLLDGFATERNMFAPILYKAMTFVLIESYLNLELRESLLKNFIHLFKAHPNIPIGILCEPLLKQIMINLEKQDNNIQQNSNILQPNTQLFMLNTTDFELFLSIANHPKINPAVAVNILEIVVLVARKNIIFTRVSLKLLLIILARFENNTQIFNSCQQLIVKLITIITDQDAAKVELYNELKNNPKVKNIRKASLPTGMNAGVNTNTLNAKYSDFNKLSDKIDDSQIQAIINPRIQQEQSAYYMSMRTSERLIVNLLQCLIQTGIKVLSEFSREKLLDAYIKTEKTLKFTNKGFLYLLKFFEKDVSKMIQFSMQQSVKDRTMKLQQKKQLQEQAYMLERARQGAINKSQEYDGFESVISDINILNIQVNESVDKQRISPRHAYLEKRGTIKTKKMSLIAPIIKESDRNRSLLRYGTKEDDFYSRGNDSGLGTKGIYYPETVKTRKRKSVHINKSSMNKMDFYSKDDGQIRLYEINEDSSAEQHKYLQWVKDWLKLYKAMFQKYADGAIGNSKKPGTFDHIVDAKKFMNLASIFAFLSDFKFTKVEARREDVKRIIQLVNIKQESNFKTTSDLDLEGFIEFNLQLGFYLYKEFSIRPSKFMMLLFDRFKEVSQATKTPLFQRLLENPNAPPIGDQHTIQVLTEQVNKYPESQLPQGYVKVKVDRIKEIQGPDPNIYKKESQRIGVMVLDDLFSEIFGIALLEPMIRYEKRWAVKHEVQNQKPKPKARYNEVGERHRFKSYIETEEEKMKLLKVPQHNHNTRRQINQRISMDSDQPTGVTSMPIGKTRSSYQIDGKKRPFGSQSPEAKRPQYRAKYNKYNQNNQQEPINFKIKQQLTMATPDNGAYPREPNSDLEDTLGQQYYTKRQLSHRSPAVRGNINQAQQNRMSKALRDEAVKLTTEEKGIKRQAYLKNKLEKYQTEKKTKDAQKHFIDKDAVEQEKLDILKKEQDKKNYYARLQKNFEKKRLPTITKNKVKEDELKALLYEDKIYRREEALKKIDENTKNLQKQWNEVSRQKDNELDKPSIKKFETIRRDLSPQKQEQNDRINNARANTLPKQVPVVKETPLKNPKAEKQRLWVEKNSTKPTKKDEAKNLSPSRNQQPIQNQQPSQNLSPNKNQQQSQNSSPSKNQSPSKNNNNKR